jgi:hypothetical protein
MKIRLAFCVCALLFCGFDLHAQQPAAKKGESHATALPSAQAADRAATPSLSAPAPTPELWVYSQEQQRHDDPAHAVRRKAEIKADQRLARLSALRWYGQSNSRPETSPLPSMGVYSPTWIGNSWSRYEWPAAGTTSLILWYDDYGVRR